MKTAPPETVLTRLPRGQIIAGIIGQVEVAPLTVIRLGIFVLLGWLVVAAFSAPGDGDHVTVCRAMCNPLEFEFWECSAKGGKLSPVGALHFKVSIPEQTVFEERDGGPYKFTKCKVMDLRNWSCPYNDNSGEIGMGKGEYYETYGEPLKGCAYCKATGQIPCSS